ncbi:Fe-S cluster assembly protein SufD [Paractinoplanes brasiliensis]|uniref:Iron-regulated ABC transporter permease protein SufD n=1 Tax=Paractinoplanes brasiliensis TaxID=52695 RepID=A0A4R6JMI8_9ACTN|nr:Fe-S cluster assembly protein SufD [Actinoplanes brasiliensis]TDO37574.1 iron-regulated ABC transporter permease protein SufD [Actinoplanes brasiliensis]GID31858.1 Fe-S cluster assembly protein SufD [Actinoplanes brasiliensis]
MTTETTIAPPSTKSQVLSSFDVTEFPAVNGLEEEWRFTPIKRLRELVTATALTGTAPQLETGELPAGVSVTAGATVEPVLTPFDRISALAYGSSDGVTLIEVAPETEPEQAVVIRLVGKGGEAAAARTFVKIGAFAKVTLVLEQTGTATLADNIEVVVGDSAQLTFVTIADWDAGAVQAQHVRIRLGRDARASHVQVALGGDLVRQFTSVEYTGRGGDAELWGLYFADAGQHFEHRQLVDHSVPDCRSYVGYRGALQGASAQTVWVGDVLIRAAATGTETYEINRNLILTDGAVAHSVPNLEIETGEIVGAGHASATGRFDDEQLFYLMARGIPEAEARRLVVRGFFVELINKIPVEELRERLGDAIESRLAEYSS